METTTPNKKETNEKTNKQNSLIPSLLTTSLRTAFDIFGENITSIHAHGGAETTNSTTIEELRKYGITREQESHQRLILDYQQLTLDGEPSNPLTPEAQEKILTEIETILDTDQLDVKPDLTVTSLTARIEEPRLMEVTPAQTPEFDLTFIADPAENPVQEQTKRRNRGKGLYGQLGFNIKNLNLRSVVETAAKHHQQSNGRYLSWGGPEDIRPRSPKKLAVRINKHILPNTYGILKPYQVIDDHTLELSSSIEQQLIDNETTQPANEEREV